MKAFTQIRGTSIWQYLAMLLVLTLPIAAAQARSGSYQIQPGDRLSLTVWKEPDLTGEVLVMPDGAISFPLAGVVSAYGQTVNGLQKLLTDKLARFISNPVVSITVLEVSGNKVYVVGQVKNPGEMIMNPPLDVLQALAKAGGLTPFADQNNIRIIRRNSDGTLFQLGFEYGSVLKGRSLDQNIMLNSGDLILVP